MTASTQHAAGCRIREIRLRGVLGKRFGKSHKISVAHLAEGIRAIGIREKGFTQYLNEARAKGIVFAVFYGGRNVGADQLRDPPGNCVMYIVPVVEGSKKSGGLQTVVGLVLVAVASYFTAGAAAPGGSAALFGTASAAWTVAGTVGLSLAIGGVAQMIAGTQKGLTSSESADNQPSYNFNGVKNTTTQGNPVPLCYGEMTVGSACVSIGILAEDKQ